MKDSKRQTMLLVGFAMIVISAIMVYVSLSSPRVYVEKTEPASAESSSAHSAQTTVPNSTVAKTIGSSGVSYPINLNTATAEALMHIEGIGEKRAADIIAYREAIGGYKSVEEIKNIKGIGDTLYNQISPYLTV